MNTNPQGVVTPREGGGELKSTFKYWDEGMGWIDLVQDRDRLSSVVSTVQSIQLLKNAGDFFSS